jgi:protein TonB
MTFCRTLMLMLASCLIVGCAAQDRHTPPAGSATSTAPTPAPSSTPSPPPGLTPAPDQEPDRILPDGSVAPKTGEYIYVEELPEAITRVRPNYPGEARRKGIEGTVMLQCLVLRDGAVGDVRIVKSVPGLDEAAVTCLGQWRFKPAMAKGQPVTVWVGVPVKFSLH